MIDFMPESGGNIVGIRASGKLTGADYERSLTPRLEALIEQHGRIRVLFLMDETPRMNGRRHYDADMVRMIEVLRFAQQAGFTLEEIKTLFPGVDRGAALGEAWRSLGRSKLAELDAVVANARRMQRAIEAGLRCGCMRLEDCRLPEAAGMATARRRKQTTQGPR